MDNAEIINKYIKGDISGQKAIKELMKNGWKRKEIDKFLFPQCKGVPNKIIKGK